MKVTITSSTYDFGCCRSLKFVSDKNRLSFHDGEPEDNNLGRNFNSCYSIDRLIREAYEAGKNGEELIIEEVEELDDE